MVWSAGLVGVSKHLRLTGCTSKRQLHNSFHAALKGGSMGLPHLAGVSGLLGR